MVQVSLLGGFGTPFVLDHAAFSKTVNARASLGTGRTSRVHSVVFPSLTWLCPGSRSNFALWFLSELESLLHKECHFAASLGILVGSSAGNLALWRHS